MTTTDLRDLGFSEDFIAGFFPTETAPALPAFSQAGLASLIS